MEYRSTCRACSHWHNGICSTMTHKVGTIRLKSWDQSLWGINGGLVKGYDYSNGGSEQLSFKPFNTGMEQAFEYSQETDCGCRLYVPSENLEFLEWKYEQSK